MTVRSATLVVVAAILAGVVWFGLSLATGLIFHFMPAAPMLVAVWALRAASQEAVRAFDVAAAISVGALMTVATAPAIALAGGSLDEAWQVGVVAVIGIALAAWLGRRRLDRRDLRSVLEPEIDHGAPSP